MNTPATKKHHTISPLWIFPLLTAIAAAYLTYDTFKTRGPTILIRYTEASNIEAGKSTLRYRGVIVGNIESVELGEDLKEVVVKARLMKSAEKLAVEGTKFILVQPEISFQGVKGLDTIVGGSYITIEPGNGVSKRDFHGQFINQDGNINKSGKVAFNIRAKQMYSIGKGDPITYRGLTVGSVSHAELGKTGEWLEFRIEIETRYRKLIRRNTVFWRASGIQADLGLFSSKVDISSVEAVMKGAIAFATPDKADRPADPGKIFDLQPSAPEAWEKWSPKL